ncbi:VOC family protein [Rhodospirillum centenum]|uniref:Glyoxalase family protein n=1 Tax=Rhodospirillum centenum (strain ATCC 51521 / SW) TaxID=414684 RepID=B6IU24_RHOCS|nr:VOC family protein [Rhodospirillum centenum]ACI99901.1 glyoxalase family protein [Rhodospirillum centenum SW]
MNAQANAVQTPAPEDRPAIEGGVVPYLQVDGAIEAAAFYGRALGAEQRAIRAADQKGRTMHVHMLINGGSVMLSDPCPEQGYPQQPAQGFTLLLAVDDVQAWWDRAVGAGMTEAMPLQDMAWGDRYGQLRDPFGVTWALASPIR